MEVLRNNLLGNWTGKNLLRLSWLEPSDFYSDSTMTIVPVAQEKFLEIKYTWSHEGAPHAGVLLLGYDKSQAVVTAAWVDSWHMSSEIMACRGTVEESGTIEVQGFYKAPPGPDWGWRIELSMSSAQNLKMEMFNCSPEGVEDLAVRAEYERR